MESNIQCKIDSYIQLYKSYVERISPSVSGFGLSVVTDAAALLKIYQNLEIKLNFEKEAAHGSKFVHINRCLRTARKLGSSKLSSSRGSF